MRKSVTYLITLALVLSLTGMASAAAKVNWDGGGADSLWTTVGNWAADVLPGTGEKAMINASKDALIDSTVAVTHAGVVAEYGIDITGGSLTVNGWLGVTTGKGPVGSELNMSDGYVWTNALNVGSAADNGDMTMSGGLIEAGLARLTGAAYQPGLYLAKESAWGSGAVGSLNMTGGTIVAFTLGINDIGGSGGKIEIANDAAILVKDTEFMFDGASVANDLYKYLDNGWITTSDGDRPDVQEVTYDGYTYTELTVPEPMTIALLGLGGLFLRRRK